MGFYLTKNSDMKDLVLSFKTENNVGIRIYKRTLETFDKVIECTQAVADQYITSLELISVDYNEKDSFKLPFNNGQNTQQNLALQDQNYYPREILRENKCFGVIPPQESNIVHFFYPI